jgi:erythromycin esterase-like protein
MTVISSEPLAHAIRDVAQPLVGRPEDFDPLLARVGDARFVLIGGASHGTHEFYRIRSEITKRLIREKGFTAVAVEGDWPDAYRVNRYVRGATDDHDASDALAGFKHFPQWIWRNADVLDFVGWLRAHNERPLANQRPVGFYGLDLFSLHASIASVLRYLRAVDPRAAERAQHRYSCFTMHGEDPEIYGHVEGLGVTKTCQAAAVEELVKLLRNAPRYESPDVRLAPDDQFFAEQNARLVYNAERYYRAMFGDYVSAWNIRDQHMVETLGNLVSFLDRVESPAKIAVWAHNSHVGNARATEMGAEGQLNLGQLLRQNFGRAAVLIGFSTYSGTVTAASNWDEPAKRMIVRPALPESYEGVFHDVGPQNFMLDLAANNDATVGLSRARLQRAIGVVYRPETERMSHYSFSHLTRQFDLVLHYDHTRAVEPLERSGIWNRGELPETYPTAL